MAAYRPVVTVYNAANGRKSETVALPAVFAAPIRNDVVHFVHMNIAKNHRQPYAVARLAGMETSADSWGTGRAVARIPRVAGGGTHRAGQGAFGNMCRGGRMFAPTRIWRHWNRRVSVNQRRFATVSALAASAIPALVMARGHKIGRVNEIPLVLQNLESIQKTKTAYAILKRFGASADVDHAKDSKKVRPGVGKMRNRRYVVRRGPLVIYNGDNGVTRAFRNLPGVECVNVHRLNLLQLAPGGHLGRFCIWTSDAFAELDRLFGTGKTKATLKSGYVMPRHTLTNGDLGRIINSSAVQAVVRPAKKADRYSALKKNPLSNFGAMVKLNPYALTLRRAELRAQNERASQAAKDRVFKTKRVRPSAEQNAARKAGLAYYRSSLEDTYKTPKSA